MKNKLVIVAGLGLLRAYRIDVTPQGTPRLESLEELVLEEAHSRFSDRVTDLAGRNGAPTQRNWGAPMSDDHNYKLEFKRRLIRRLSERIRELVEEHATNGCWFAAPKEINQQMLNELSPANRKRVQRNLACDLTKVSPGEILTHFGRL
jgi:Protein required for attachment to host cells